MTSRRRFALLLTVTFVVCFTCVFAFSLQAGQWLPGQKPGSYDHGDCCFRPNDPLNCGACRGVWLCDDPNDKFTCACVCSPIAANYGCPWTIPVWCN